MFECMCASEDCKIHGCARLRNLISGPQPEIRPTPPANIGWICPKCGGVNAPAALVCNHCSPRTLKITCEGGRDDDR